MRETDFTPASCNSPPLNCWDGLNKEKFGKCTKNSKDILLRGNFLVKSNTANCYKSMYINMDSSTFAIVVILLLWFQLMHFGVSRFFHYFYISKLDKIVNPTI